MFRNLSNQNHVNGSKKKIFLPNALNFHPITHHEETTFFSPLPVKWNDQICGKQTWLRPVHRIIGMVSSFLVN